MALTPPRIRRVGVFGGAFDPPHLAHRALVQAALAQFPLDEFRVVPTGQAWHKARTLTAPAHRLAMAELNFGDLPGVRVDACEIQRDGPSYTVDTLRELHNALAPVALTLFMGADQARALTLWREWQEIPRLAIICVAGRADSTLAEAGFQAPRGLEKRFQTLPMPPIAVSATQIRDRLATHQDIAELVFAPVARYIDLHHLYQDA